MLSPNPGSHENDDDADGQGDCSSEKNRGSAVETAGLNQVPSMPTHVCPACGEYHTSEQKYWQKQVFWQRISAIATVLAFAAAFVYAYFAHQQVDAMRESVTKSQNLVNQQIEANKTAGSAANAAINAAKIASDTLALSQAAVAADIEVDDIKCSTPRFQPDTTITVLLKNVGQTRATDIIPKWGIVGQTDKCMPKKYDLGELAVLAPNQPPLVTGPIDNLGVCVPAGALQTWRSGGGTGFSIAGWVDFKDILGKQRRTQINFESSSNGECHFASVARRSPYLPDDQK